MRPSSPSGKSVATIASPTGPRLADGGLEVHLQSGAGIDFDDRPPCSSSGRPMSSAMTSMPGHVQADHLRGQLRLRGDARVDEVGDVGRQVAVVLDDHLFAGFGNRIDRVAFVFDGEQERFVDLDCAERMLNFEPAARSELICDSISSQTVCWPSPTMETASPRVAATSFPPTTSKRCSAPAPFFRQ